MRSRYLIAIAAGAALVLASPHPAVAQQGDGSRLVQSESGEYPGGSGDVVGGQLDVSAQDGQVPDPDLPQGGESECTWRLHINDDTVRQVFDVYGQRLLSETGRWFEPSSLECGGGFFAVPEGGELDLVGLRARARDAVAPGEPAAQIPPLIWVEDQYLEMWLVQAPLWLWIDETYWQTYTAGASAGRANAVGIATPDTVIWDPGDVYDPDEIVVCEGDDVTFAVDDYLYREWAFGAGVEREWDEVHGIYDEWSAPTSCFYTYHHDSADEPDRSFVLSTEASFATEVIISVGAVEIGRWVMDPIIENTARSIHVGQAFALAAD